MPSEDEEIRRIMDNENKIEKLEESLALCQPLQMEDYQELKERIKKLEGRCDLFNQWDTESAKVEQDLQKQIKKLEAVLKIISEVLYQCKDIALSDLDEIAKQLVSGGSQDDMEAWYKSGVLDKPLIQYTNCKNWSDDKCSLDGITECPINCIKLKEEPKQDEGYLRGLKAGKSFSMKKEIDELNDKIIKIIQDPLKKEFVEDLNKIKEKGEKDKVSSYYWYSDRIEELIAKHSGEG